MSWTGANLIEAGLTGAGREGLGRLHQDELSDVQRAGRMHGVKPRGRAIVR
jgi:hypothetical protein